MKIIIYGIFDGERCIYVGRTSDLERRMIGHKRWLKDEFQEPLPSARVLQTVEANEAPESERLMILSYAGKGEANYNVRGTRETAIKSVSVSARLHDAIKLISVLERRPIFQVCDELLLPVLEKRLAELKREEWQDFTPAQKSRAAHAGRTTNRHEQPA